MGMFTLEVGDRRIFKYLQAVDLIEKGPLLGLLLSCSCVARHSRSRTITIHALLLLANHTACLWHVNIRR